LLYNGSQLVSGGSQILLTTVGIPA